MKLPRSTQPYLWTRQGWVYLAVVLDLFSRKVVGWSVQAEMKTALVEAALSQAAQRRQPPRGLLFHSDRGSQYASDAFRQRLQLYGLTAFMSRKGDCYDNSPVERFFGSLKKEWIPPMGYSHLEHARLDVLRYIEMFYNSKRLHSTLGYLAPSQFEALSQVA